MFRCSEGIENRLRTIVNAVSTRMDVFNDVQSDDAVQPVPVLAAVQPAATPPDLDRDLWPAFARATQRLENSVSAWLCLSLVSRAWRDALAGAAVSIVHLGARPGFAQPAQLSTRLLPRVRASTFSTCKGCRQPSLRQMH